YVILWIPMFVLVSVPERILRYFFGVGSANQSVVFGRVDLSNYVREIAKTSEIAKEEPDHELQILQNALDFSEVKARDCMVPRTEIAAVSVDDDLDLLREVFIETGFSKALVYRGNIDNII